MSKSSKRLCSKCWTEITDDDEEASYLGISLEMLRAIRNYKPKVFRRRKRGNKYVKFYNQDHRISK